MGTVLALLISLFSCFIAIIVLATSSNPPSRKLTVFLEIVCFFFFIAIVSYAIKDNMKDDIKENSQDEYILPNSDKELLEEDDIDELDEEELMLARNEIYARHGRRFNDKKIQSYFDTKSWYKGVVLPEEFQQETLSWKEQKNVEFILKYENPENAVYDHVLSQ